MRLLILLLLAIGISGCVTTKRFHELENAKAYCSNPERVDEYSSYKECYNEQREMLTSRWKNEDGVGGPVVTEKRSTVHERYFSIHDYCIDPENAKHFDSYEECYDERRERLSLGRSYRRNQQQKHHQQQLEDQAQREHTGDGIAKSLGQIGSGLSRSGNTMTPKETNCTTVNEFGTLRTTCN